MSKRILSWILVFVTIASLMLPALSPEVNALTYNGSSSYRSGKYYTNLTNITLTGDPRTDIVKIANSQIGYQEGSSSSSLSGTVRGNGNCTEYGRWYGLQDMWCAMFVSWCAHVAGIPTSVVPSHSYTPTGLNWFKNKGQAYSRATVAAGGYTPQPGDIIYFKSSRNQNITNHVGIVTSYSNGTVYTVEGNTSSATVSTNGGAVCSKSYSISNTYIVYICKPNYTTQSSADSLKSVVFDPTYYSDNHPDLKEAFGTDANALYDHFQTYGVKEGRQASPSFSVKYYLQNNTHVQEAVGNTTDYEAAYKYFLSTGYKKKAKTAQPADLGERFFAKINYSTGKNLSLSGNNVIVYSESDKPAQVWQFIRQANGSYQIVNAKNSMNLSTTGNGNTSGTNVEIAVGAGDSGQRWFLYPSGSKYILRPYCSAYCMLDVADGSTADLTNIQIHTANNAKAQKFSINKVDYSASEAACDLGDDVFVKISNVASGNYLATSSNNIVSAADKSSATRVFRLMHESDGAYRIVGQNSNKTITVEGAADADGTNVHATSNSSLTSQRWYICRLGDHYTLRPVSSTDRRMEVADGSTVSGANVQIGTFTGGDEQLFDITQVDYFQAVAPKDLGADFLAVLTNVASEKNMTLNGTNVISNAPSTAVAQNWRFLRQPDGSYLVSNQKNGKLLDLAVANGGDGTNVQISDPAAALSPYWYIYVIGGKYCLRPAGVANCLLAVDGGSTADGANILINSFNGKSAQRFAFAITENISSAADLGITDAQMEVLRNIIYAVESGGQVYGNNNYSAFAEAYANSSEEHAITIGAGQWYANEAKTLLNNIRAADPAAFAKLDTAGIGADLDSADWSTYKVTKSSAKGKCIISIISSAVGISCQDALLDQQMVAYMAEAKKLGVTAIDALMECANIRHQGGLGGLQRVLGKTATPYTLDNIYAALQTDTGNQVGTYTSRQKFVYEHLKKYISSAVVEPEPTVKYLPACDASEVSIVTALTNVGVANVTPEYRMRLAIANGITDYAYTADQNIQMLDLLKAGKLIDPEGVKLSGWYTFTGGKRYYYDTNGNQVTGWLTQGGKTYYLNPATGVMATGTTEIDGVSYDFGTDGVLVTDADCAHESHDAEGVCISCREDVGHSYTSVVTGATCEAQGYTTYTCTCGHSYVSDYTAANGHTFVAGFCEVCEAPDPNPIVVPTLTLSYPNLNFESRVEYNIYFTAQDLDNVEEMGLITFTEPTVDGTIEEADDVIPGYVTSGQHYMVHTHGISPRFLSDALYFRVYAKLTDGTYVYSDTAAYHAVAYAKDILARSTNAKMRSLVVAMLNYGAAAQLQFGYKTDSLMNSFLSDEQKALVDTYSSDMVASAKGADISKTGSFAYVKGGYTALYPRVSFEGAFGINYFFTPAKAMDGNLTMYYWTLEDYTAADVLTPENATGVITMESISGSYTGSVEGIAARQIDETVYVAGIYESEGVPYPTGVIAYSLGAYCVDRATNDTGTMQELAKHTAVYGYYAKNYFAHLAG